MTAPVILAPGQSVTVAAAPLPPPPPFRGIVAELADAIAAGRSRLVVPAGVYHERVTWTQPGVTLDLSAGAVIDGAGIAVPQQQGIFMPGPLATVIGGEVRNSTAAGGDFSRVADVAVLGTRFHDNAEEGYHVNACQRLTFLRCRFDRNNPTLSWTAVDEQGAGKISNSRQVRFIDCEADHNGGHGIWFDVSDVDCQVLGCRSHHNAGIGILDETSDQVEIGGCRTWENGWGPGKDQQTWAWGAGIVSSSSSRSRIHHSIAAWNADGIVVLAQNRSDGKVAVGSVIEDCLIATTRQPFDHSDIKALGFLADSAPGLTMFASTSGNRIARCQVYRGDGRSGDAYRYDWAGSRTSIAALNAVCNAGSALPSSDLNTEITLDQLVPLLVAAGVPTAPESHPSGWAWSAGA